MGVLTPQIALARISRARKCLGHHTVYALSKGGYPTWAPGDPSDCSGWISWLLQTKREPKPGRAFWIETTAIYHDAIGAESVFVRLKAPEPGCLVVYPDHGSSQGHIGLVTNPSAGKLIGIDCGHGNYVHHGDAIREHELTYFETNSHSIFVALEQDLAA